MSRNRKQLIIYGGLLSAIVVAFIVFYFSNNELTPTDPQVDDQAQLVQNSGDPEKQADSELDSTNVSKSSDVVATEPDYQVSMSPSHPLFGVISEDDFFADLESAYSKVPKNDGRVEVLDENGNVIASSSRSPQEEIDLGYDDVNKYKRQGIPYSELKELAAQKDPAAHVELARLAYRNNDLESGEQAIIEAAKILGKPAPMSIAGGILGSPRNGYIEQSIGAAWYLAAYQSGDYTVAANIRSLFLGLPEENQLFAIEHAQEILSRLN